MDFCAIDVETANADMASICQVGIAVFSDSKIVKEWSVLVDPEDFFDGMNISIHGISDRDVKDAPKFPEIYAQLRTLMEGNVCVSHTHFDRVSFGKALSKYGLEPFSVKWLDSAKVARRVWEDCAYSGYGLSALCERFGYTFKHHDALEDAKAAGHVLLRAVEESHIDLDQWIIRSGKPIATLKNERSGVKGFIRIGNPDGDMAGNLLVFTGSLSISRSDAADIAASSGFDVADTMTKKVNFLVVGDQDVSKLAGKSSKHLKAEDLILQGYPIRIIKESDFVDIVNTSLEGQSK